MDEIYIREMATAIQTATGISAEQILPGLTAYWSDKIADVWSVQNVITQAREMGIPITRATAVDILQNIHYCLDPNWGITWESLQIALRETDPLRLEVMSQEQLHELLGPFVVWTKLDASAPFEYLDEALSVAREMAGAAPGETAWVGLFQGKSGPAPVEKILVRALLAVTQEAIGRPAVVEDARSEFVAMTQAFRDREKVYAT